MKSTTTKPRTFFPLKIRSTRSDEDLERLRFRFTTGQDSESRRTLESIIKTSDRWDEVLTLDRKPLDSILLEHRWEAEPEEELLRFAAPFEESRITVSSLRESHFD